MAAATTVPTRKDAVRNRRRILAAAGEVLREDFQNASVPLVAERAGVGPATVYRYFPSLEILLREYLAGVEVELRDFSHDCPKTGPALFEAVVAKLGELLEINGRAMTHLRSRRGFLTRLHDGDAVIQTVREAWERPVRGVMRSKRIGDAHFDHALFLYNLMFDPREVLDLVDEGLTMPQALKLLTDAYYGALDGMAGADR